MDYKELVDQHVRPALNDSFGAAMATMIFASASNTAGVPIMGISRPQYVALVEAVCTDQRVIDMWGSMGSADRRREWSALG